MLHPSERADVGSGTKARTREYSFDSMPGAIKPLLCWKGREICAGRSPFGPSLGGARASPATLLGSRAAPTLRSGSPGAGPLHRRRHASDSDSLNRDNRSCVDVSRNIKIITQIFNRAAVNI